MDFYERRLFNPLMDRVLGRPAVATERARLLAAARGVILEIGPGTGLNLDSYPPEVTRITAAVPGGVIDPRARRRAEARGLALEVLDAGAEALPLGDGTVDPAVSTFVLCTVADQAAAIAELRRVLRPGGRLLLLEHVARRGAGRLAQRALDPVNRVVACGCRLTRDTGAALAVHFDVSRLEEVELAALPWPARRVLRGAAAPRGSG